MATTTHRQCTLCEAHCGIDVTVEGTKVLRIAGDPEDHSSKGYICPKAAALADLHADPDRLRRPVRRTATGWEELGWDEALDYAGEGLRQVAARHGRTAVANYLGNPGAHSWSLLSMVTLRLVLGWRGSYSAASSDQNPQHLVAGEMFGTPLALSVPDVDRTDHMLVLGANPAVSNGSIMQAPGIRDRLRAIAERGTVVVVDPRRTETARLATEHVSIRPGGDPFLLLGMLHVIFAEGRATLGSLEGHVDGLEALEALAAGWSPARAEPHCDVPADTIARLAREFADAERAVAYGRVGVCHQPTGSVTHWLITALNVVTGNLDAPGGAMFTTPVLDPTPIFKLLTRLGVGPLHRRRRQRVSGLPDVLGEFPAAFLAEEITTPGEGQVRGLLVYAGNPVLSTAGGSRLDAALGELEFMVAVDSFVTETTRHANVILPPVSHLERDDFDIALSAFAARNHVRFNPAALPQPVDSREDWQILEALAARVGVGVRGRALSLGVGVGARLGLTSPARIAGLAVATGPYGVLRRGIRKGLTLGRIRSAVHGIDLGPLEPRLPGALTTKDGRLHLTPELLLDEAAALEQRAGEQDGARAAGFDLTLIGRRSLRSNNSWLHNSPRLMKGRDRCTALLHPDEAAARGVADGDRVRVASAQGAIELPLEVSDEIRPGVVSIPHGFGHDRPGVGWTHAATKPGVSVNDITDPAIVDRLTGTAAFNAVPVSLEAVDQTPLEDVERVVTA